MKLTLITLTLAALVLSGGCASPGGYVIGPVSSITSKSNQKAMIKRAAINSGVLSKEQKRQVFKATAATHDPGEISIMVGVDILQLRGSKLTKGEIGKQALGVLSDAVIYGLAAYAGSEALDLGGSDDGGDSSSEDNSISIDITGSDETTIVIDGDTSTSDSNIQN